MTRTVLAMVLATAVGLASATAFADSKNAGGGPGNSGPGDKNSPVQGPPDNDKHSPPGGFDPSSKK
jgi:hypothetical protein